MGKQNGGSKGQAPAAAHNNKGPRGQQSKSFIRGEHKPGNFSKQRVAQNTSMSSQGTTSAVATDSSDGQKLTKQQKRDLKRNAAAAAARSSATTYTPRNDPDVTVAVAKVAVAGESVYKRKTEFPPAYSGSAKPDNFLGPDDESLPSVLAECYPGFVTEPKSFYSDQFHEQFKAALEGLEKEGSYQFDLTQPAGLGTKVAKTFVTRNLVGIPGITYKYLGLRMFGHPWTVGEVGCSEHTASIGRLNDEMILKTRKMLKKSGKEVYGSCEYNLTLINHCFPESDSSVTLKHEPLFQKDKCTVSWHADSSLEHFSTIGVYHVTSPLEGPNAKDWRIAMRAKHNAEGPQQGKPSPCPEAEQSIPPVALPLPSQHSYYLLDDFNHHYQHSVLAGSTNRFASTHRVSRVEGHTYDSIRSRCLRVLQQKFSIDYKSIRTELLCFIELEFEWLRQYYVQGEKHHQLHLWWHQPMEELMKLWSQLYNRAESMIQALCDAVELSPDNTTHIKFSATAGDDDDDNGSSSKHPSKKLKRRMKNAENVEVRCFNAMIDLLRELHEKRAGWKERYKDPMYKTVSADCRPMRIPFVVCPSRVPPPSNASTSASVDGDGAAATATATADRHEPIYYDPCNEKPQLALMTTINKLERNEDIFKKMKGGN